MAEFRNPGPQTILPFFELEGSMCGAYIYRQNRGLREELGINDPDLFSEWEQERQPDKLDPHKIPDIFSHDGPLAVARPTNYVPVITQNRLGELELRHARWWLIMQPDGESWKPNQKLASFNSTIRKVIDPGRTAHNMPPRSFRVLIPAIGWIEWHNKLPHLFKRQGGQPLMLGGMAKAYRLPGDQYLLSTSMVTLPGHPKTQHIHAKSIPLSVPPQDQGSWLDREVPNHAFDDYLEPRIWTPLTIQPLKDAGSLEPAGEEEIIEPDAA